MMKSNNENLWKFMKIKYSKNEDKSKQKSMIMHICI